jgi:hypothetical protein
MNSLRSIVKTGLLVAWLVSAAATTRADFVARVSLDTAPLVGHPAAPFYLDFQLNQGSGPSPSNTAVLSDFAFSGGAPTGSPFLIGGAAGDLGTGATITDSAFSSEFIQEFSPGTQLQFNIDLTTNPETNPPMIPDQFSFAILDSTFSELPTLDPSGSNTFLTIDIDSSFPTPLGFGSDPGRPPAGGGLSIDIGPPMVITSAVSEPPSFVLAMIAVVIWKVLSRPNEEARPCAPRTSAFRAD